MMTEKRLLVLALAGAAVLAAWTPPAPAQDCSWLSMETSQEWKDMVNRCKNPTDWFTWGADLRLREIYELFPMGPAKGACKIAGLPKPDGCV